MRLGTQSVQPRPRDQHQINQTQGLGGSLHPRYRWRHRLGRQCDVLSSLSPDIIGRSGKFVAAACQAKPSNDHHRRFMPHPLRHPVLMNPLPLIAF